MNAERIRTAVVPAAGRGVRAYPRTARVPKVLLEVAGKPLLHRNLEILRRDLGVERAVLLVGHLADQVRASVGDGSAFGLRVEYVDVPDPSEGLARGLALARDRVREPFVCILGDELYYGSSHAALLPLPEPWEAAVCVMETDDPRRIRKNYSVDTDAEGFVRALEEKPDRPSGTLLGCGTYFFRPSIFDAIDRTPPHPRTGRVELTDAIFALVREGKSVRALRLEGEYFNINSIEDQNYANYLVRSREFAKTRISLIVPTWNEAESIRAVLRDFKPHVHEIVVADNLSEDGTADIAREEGARVVSRRLRGYGDALRAGMDAATGDILVLVEADHSFRSKDLGKILEYMKDADMVIGTRTTRQMIEQGTNMKGIVRWANVFVGKLIEALWWPQEPRFTDVGCTFRAIWREVYEKMRPNLRGLGPEFSPEMMIEILRMQRRVVEIPVSYYPRIAGDSKHSGGYGALARTALRMLRLILAKRFVGR